MTALDDALRICRAYDPAYPWPALLVSLLECGQLDPVCVAADGSVIYGNRRLIALRALGMPVRTVTLGQLRAQRAGRLDDHGRDLLS